MTEVTCPYCSKPARLTDGTEIYPHRADLASKRFYTCKPCGAFTGCHIGTTTPLGTLANPATRRARTRAHAAFDELWKSKAMTRSDAYAWLATELNLTAAECHIGMFDVKTCNAVVTAVGGIDITKIPKAKGKIPSRKFNQPRFDNTKYVEHDYDT